jgi:hypothetical protein
VVDLDAVVGEQLLHVAVGGPKRRYQRIARTMMLSGKENPKADGAMGWGRGR